MDLVRAAMLTWNLVGGTLFIGLPAEVTVTEVCIDWLTCLVPDNAVVLVIPWDTYPDSVIARFTRADGSAGSLEAFKWPVYQG